MKITASILGLVTCFEVTNLVLIAAEELHFNVSYAKGVETDYLRLKRRKPSMRPPREEKLRSKENICTAIIAFFGVHNVEMVNPDHRTIYKQVKLIHPKIHEEHFKRDHSSEFIKPKFANPYKLREVSVAGDVVQDYMFSCLTRNCVTKTIQQYFVSPEYDVHWSSSPVRFVFADNDEQKRVVIAVAEKNGGKLGFNHAGLTTERQAPAQSSTKTTKESDPAYDDDEESESESW